MMPKRVRKALIPAAGFGTRFLPATKAQPKEMIPVVDKPVIQYVVEEAVAAGIESILIVVSREKGAIQDHFDRNPELERKLEAAGKKDALALVRQITDLAVVHFIRQPEQRGLGDAIRYGRHHVGDEPFAVLLGDTLIRSRTPPMRQVVDVYERFGGSVIGLEEVDADKVSRYGIVAGEPVGDGVLRLRELVEKPDPSEAPSRLAIAGRYVLTPEIFDCIDRTPPGRGGEVQITDAIRLLNESQPVYGLQLEGVRHDIGNLLDYLKASVEYALERPDIGSDFLEYLQRRLAEE